MDIKVEYSKREVENLVLEAHSKKFYSAPKGEHWVANESFGTWTVQNVEDENEKWTKVPAVPEVVTPPVAASSDDKVLF